jgi:hypothetical protein
MPSVSMLERDACDRCQVLTVERDALLHQCQRQEEELASLRCQLEVEKSLKAAYFAELQKLWGGIERALAPGGGA